MWFHEHSRCIKTDTYIGNFKNILLLRQIVCMLYCSVSKCDALMSIINIIEDNGK